MKTVWNTFRHYDDQGQLIIARHVSTDDHSYIQFDDLSRGISGEFHTESAPIDEDDLRSRVMDCYDVNDFVSIGRIEDKYPWEQRQEMAVIAEGFDNSPYLKYYADAIRRAKGL